MTWLETQPCYQNTLYLNSGTWTILHIIYLFEFQKWRIYVNTIILLRNKVKGAVAYCTAKRLTKKCIYEDETKYLVQTVDSVEHQGCIFVFYPQSKLWLS